MITPALVQVVSNVPVRRLALDSAANNPIANEQVLYTSSGAERERLIRDCQKDMGTAGAIRGEPTRVYNCHGLTFGGRRTSIPLEEVEKIRQEDCLEEISVTKVLPGDIVFYYHESGELEHTGIVASFPNDFNVPMVVSKWGYSCEVLHLATDVPYSKASLKYFRARTWKAK